MGLYPTHRVELFTYKWRWVTNVSVVVQDRMVIVDGEAYCLHNYGFPEDVWAIQWFGDKGHVEYKSELSKPNRRLTLDDFALVVRPYVTVWAAEKAKAVAAVEEKAAADEAAYNSLEARFARLRQERDQRLADTDYYVMADYPSESVMLAEVKAYRQALRELPEQMGAPWTDDTVPWPVNPLQVNTALHHYQPTV